MSTNINFNKKLGLKGGSLITLPTSSTPSFSNVNSFLFDGVDEKMFSTANYTELNGSTNFSVSFWLKPIDSNDGLVFRFGTQGSTNRLACIYYPSLEIVIISFGTSSYYYRSVNGSIPLNQWSHIVYTYDGTQSRYNRPEIYVNGVLSQGTNNGVINSQSYFDGTLELGGTGTSGQQNFGNNYIDEFAVWNSTTLTQTQANELYNSGTPSNLNNIASGLTSPTTWFRMGEEATWNGFTWTMTDVNGGTVLRAANMQESSRTTDVPPNPFVNTKSILLDGVDDYVSIPSISFSGEFTISAWVKFTTLSSAEANIINTGTSNSNRVGVYSSTSFQVKATGTNVYFNETGGNDFVTNQWQHVLVTRDSSNNMSVFRNGSSFGSSITLSNTLTLDSIFRFKSTQYALGSCDELALWSSDQSANVSTIYNGGVPNDLTSLSPLIWFRMGDNATWNGATWTMTSVGTDTRIARSINMVEANRTTDVPTASTFANTKSILLDGVDDFVDIGNPSNLSSITSISISAWFKTTDSVGSLVIVGSDSSTQGRRYVLRTHNSSGIKLRFFSFYANGPYNDIIGTTNINDGQWHHVLAINNGTNLKIYVDGVLDNSNTDGNLINTTFATPNINIGRRSYSGVEGYFDGSIDEVAIWSNDQSANASAIGGTIPTDLSAYNPLGWWRCGDGDTSPTLTDNGSGGNDGTMTNFTTFSTDVPT